MSIATHKNMPCDLPVRHGLAGRFAAGIAFRFGRAIEILGVFKHQDCQAGQNDELMLICEVVQELALSRQMQ